MRLYAPILDRGAVLVPMPGWRYEQEGRGVFSTSAKYSELEAKIEPNPGDMDLKLDFHRFPQWQC